MKEKLDVFKIMGEKTYDRLDVSEIMETSNNAGAQDISEILRPDMKDNQEQQNAPDFDLSDEIAQTVPSQESPQTELELTQLELQQIDLTLPETELIPDSKQPAPYRRLLWAIIKIVILIAAVISFAAFVLVGTKVQSDSMAPLISKGDWVIVNKTAKSYGRNDVILFKDSGDRKCVARIIAADGDVVDIHKNGGLIVNNKPEEREDILGETYSTDTNVQYPVIVGEGEFFVLGDNREHSDDSRNYNTGNIDKNQIIGKVIYCCKRIR